MAALGFELHQKTQLKRATRGIPGPALQIGNPGLPSLENARLILPQHQNEESHHGTE